MSYYWAVPPGFSTASANSALSGHSSLHQERAYLLSALASEESRMEQLTVSLDSVKHKLIDTESGSNPDPEEAARLKRVIRGLTRKLERSQKSQKAMVNNLAAVTSRMVMMEQHQWRKAQYEYEQRSYVPLMNSFGYNMPNTGLASPMMTPYASFPQPVVSPFSATQIYSPMMPMTPMPNPIQTPQENPGVLEQWGSPLYTPFYGQSHGRHAVQGSANETHYEVPSVPTYWPPQAHHVPAQALRTTSLPTPRIERRRTIGVDGGQRGINDSPREDEEPISPKSMPNLGSGLGGRLSLVDGASAGLRLQRKAEMTG